MTQPRGSIRLLGAGGHAKVVLATLLDAGYACAGVHDDDPALWGTVLLGHRILGPLEGARGLEPCVAAFGDNALRRTLVARFPEATWATVVHPSAQIHPSVQIREGSVVMAGAILQPEAVLGAHVIVNTGASIDHDGRLGDYVHVAPGVRLAGSVTLGEGAFLAIGTVVGPNLSVGSWSVVGAGATVLHAIPDRCLAYGSPAHPRKDLP